MVQNKRLLYVQAMTPKLQFYELDLVVQSLINNLILDIVTYVHEFTAT